MTLTITYNAMMLVVVAGALVAVGRWNRGIVRAAAMAGIAAAGFGLGIVLCRGNPFALARLWATGLFVQGPVFLAGSAVVSWRAHRVVAALHAVAAVIIGWVGVQAFFIEPTWLEVSHVRIQSAKLTRPVRLAVVADIQTDRIGDYERKVLDRVAAERPDVILYVGDYIQVSDGPTRRRLLGRLRDLLRETGLDALLGSYAVKGNIDHGDWPTAFEGLPVEVITGTRSFDVSEMRLTGLSVSDSYNTRLPVAAADRFHLVFGHYPNFARGNVEADLLIAGHTHGGQVRLPLIGPLITLSRVPRSWAAGVTDLGGGRTLVVSRGIGMERRHAPRLRFLCRPEIVIIDLLPARHSRD